MKCYQIICEECGENLGEYDLNYIQLHSRFKCKKCDYSFIPRLEERNTVKNRYAKVLHTGNEVRMKQELEKELYTCPECGKNNRKDNVVSMSFSRRTVDVQCNCGCIFEIPTVESVFEAKFGKPKEEDKVTVKDKPVTNKWIIICSTIGFMILIIALIVFVILVYYNYIL